MISARLLSIVRCADCRSALTRQPSTDGTVNDAGITPTTVYGTSWIRIGRPTAPRSAPRCVCQKRSLTTATGSAPGASSASVSVLPINAPFPRTANR